MRLKIYRVSAIVMLDFLSGCSMTNYYSDDLSYYYVTPLLYSDLTCKEINLAKNEYNNEVEYGRSKGLTYIRLKYNVTSDDLYYKVLNGHLVALNKAADRVSC